MATKTIPLSRLETDLQKTLNECADTGETIVVELPDLRPRENQCEAVAPILQANPQQFRRLAASAGQKPAIFARRRNEPRNGVHGADEKPHRATR